MEREGGERDCQKAQKTEIWDGAKMKRDKTRGKTREVRDTTCLPISSNAQLPGGDSFCSQLTSTQALALEDDQCLFIGNNS